MIWNKITSGRQNALQELLPPKRKKLLPQRSQKYRLPKVRTEQLKRCVTYRCFFNLGHFSLFRSERPERTGYGQFLTRAAAAAATATLTIIPRHQTQLVLRGLCSPWSSPQRLPSTPSKGTADDICSPYSMSAAQPQTLPLKRIEDTTSSVVWESKVLTRLSVGWAHLRSLRPEDSSSRI